MESGPGGGEYPRKTEGGQEMGNVGGKIKVTRDGLEPESTTTPPGNPGNLKKGKQLPAQKNLLCTHARQLKRTSWGKR